jgi:chromosome segregation ATPase
LKLILDHIEKYNKAIDGIQMSLLISTLRSTKVDPNLTTNRKNVNSDRISLLDFVEQYDVLSRQFEEVSKKLQTDLRTAPEYIKVLLEDCANKQSIKKQMVPRMDLKETLIDGMDSAAQELSENYTQLKNILKLMKDSQLQQVLKRLEPVLLDIKKNEANLVLYHRASRDADQPFCQQLYKTLEDLFAIDDEVNDAIPLIDGLSSNVDQVGTVVRRVSAVQKLPAAYKKSLEEVVRRRDFESRLMNQVEDLNKDIASLNVEEEQKRSKFHRTLNIGEEGPILQDMINSIIPELRDTAQVKYQVIIQVPHALKSSILPPVSSDAVADSSWMFMGSHITDDDMASIAIAHPEKKLEKSVHKEEQPNSPVVQDKDGFDDIDSDGEDLCDSLSLSSASESDLVEALNIKHSQLMESEKRIKDLERSIASISRSSGEESIPGHASLIESLQRQINDKDSQINSLSDQLVRLKENISEFQQKQAVLLNEKTILEKNLEQHRQNANANAIRLEEELKIARERESALESQYKKEQQEFQAIIEMRQVELATSQEMIAKLEAESDKMKQMLHETREEIEYRKAQIDELQHEHDRVISQMKQLEAELSNITATLEAERRAHITTLENTKQQGEVQLQALQEQLESGQQTLHAKSQQVEQLCKIVEDLQSENEKLKEMSSSLEATLAEERMKSASLQAEVEQFAKEMEEQRTLKDATQKEHNEQVSTLQKSYNEIQHLLKDMEAQYEAQIQDIDRTKSDLVRTKAQMEDLNHAHDTLCDKNRMTEAKVSELEQRIEQDEIRISQMEVVIKQLQEEIALAEKVKLEQERKIEQAEARTQETEDRMEDQIAELKRHMSAERKEMLQNVNREIEEIHCRYEERISELERSKVEFEGKIKDQYEMQTKQRLDQALEEYRKREEALKEEQNRNAPSIQKYEMEISCLKDLTEMQQQQIHEMSIRESESQARLVNAEQELEILRKHQYEQDQLVQQLRDENETFKKTDTDKQPAELEKYKEIIRQTTVMLKNKENLITRLQTEGEEVKMQNKVLRDILLDVCDLVSAPQEIISALKDIESALSARDVEPLLHHLLQRHSLASSLTHSIPATDNKVTIVMSNFDHDDHVLFTRMDENRWKILTNSPELYLLSNEYVEHLKMISGNSYDTLNLFRAQILFIDDQNAGNNNEYHLPTGTKYKLVHIYPPEDVASQKL